MSEGWIPRDRMLEKLRELGFQFRKQRDRNDLYKRSSDGALAMLDRRDRIDIAVVTATLRHAGCSEADIRAFLAKQRG